MQVHTPVTALVRLRNLSSSSIRQYRHSKLSEAIKAANENEEPTGLFPLGPKGIDDFSIQDASTDGSSITSWVNSDSIKLPHPNLDSMLDVPECVARPVSACFR